MCGIVGIALSDCSKVPDQILVEKMCSRIKHRGPDEDGILVKNNIAIGMTRLSIIDLIFNLGPEAGEFLKRIS